MGSTLIFQFLYINILNYRNFHTKCSTFLKIENVEKNKKKRYRRLLQLWIRLQQAATHHGATPESMPDKSDHLSNYQGDNVEDDRQSSDNDENDAGDLRLSAVVKMTK